MFLGLKIVDEMCQRPRSTFAVDVSEDAGGLTIVADLPGVSPEKVSVRAVEGSIAIEVSRQAETGKMLHRERATGSVSRLIKLPDSVDPRAVKKSMSDGVLVVRVAKFGRSSRLGRGFGAAARSLASVAALVLFSAAFYTVLCGALAAAPAVLATFAPIADFLLSIWFATMVFNLLFSMLLPSAPPDLVWAPPFWSPRSHYRVVAW